MALNLTRGFTYAPNATILSSENNANELALYNAFSGLEDLTSTLAKLKVDGNPATALEVATKQYVDVYAAYRRPVLRFISATTVDVENNTGTSNETKIVFPDGESRSVTEDTSSTNKYRRFDITATAEFTTGTEDSGLRSGLTEAVNTWYAIYAVKSTIDTSKFVLVGDTTLPLVANVGTLNAAYAASGWVYIGMIRNGDNSGGTGDILDFYQTGMFTKLRHIGTGNFANLIGIRMATSAAATSITWTHSNGTGATAIPDNCDMVYVQGGSSVTTGEIRLRNSAASYDHAFYSNPSSGATVGPILIGRPTDNLLLSSGSAALDIFMSGWMDGALGVGSNPLI